MKKILFLLALLNIAFAAFSCVTVPEATITGNGLFQRYAFIDPTTGNSNDLVEFTIQSSVVDDDSQVITISLPTTLSLQIGEFTDSDDINNIKLSYKNKDDEYVVIREIKDITYSLKTDTNVPHFGINTLDPNGFSAGDTLEVRVYLSDGFYEVNIDFTFLIQDNRRPY